jgi:hypothetical protein
VVIQVKSKLRREENFIRLFMSGEAVTTGQTIIPLRASQ